MPIIKKLKINYKIYIYMFFFKQLTFQKHVSQNNLLTNSTCAQMGLNQLRNTLKLKITWFRWKFHWTFISIFLKNIDIVWYWRVGQKHITKGQNCCHIILFFSVPCLNFDHVIIMKGFHNIFAYYRRSKPKKIKC